MATIRKIVYDVREALKQYTDDTNIDDRYIVYLYNNKRAKYLRQDLNNFQRTVDNSIVQKLCLELEEVSINECNVDYDCGTIMRTKRTIPKPLELHLKSAITNIKPTTKIALPFNFVNKERAVLSKYAGFNNSIYAFLDVDLHIYLVSESNAVKLIECITVDGVFEDPLELANYLNCCGCEIPKVCFSEDTTDYPLSAHHIDYIREEIIQSLIGTLQVPEDKNNNSDDE